MSEYVLTEFRKGFYLDSVVLMRLSREIAAMDGIVEAALMMGSPSNIAIMRDAGLLKGDAGARSNDLVLALRARSEVAAKKALSAALRTLERPKGSSAEGRAWRPRTLAAAVREVPDANLALISVPGEFAAAEARKALRRGLNVLMFSDNVLLEDELSLKEEARDFGLLMMGPDCGTAIINGVPLAFANRLQRGSIGIIGASGTGVQEVSCLISEAGGGISHAIGVGGRDLKREIGGITTLMAMDALDADESTDSVVLISKPPHPEVARKVIERIAHSSKPYTVCFIGAETLDLPGNARQAHTLRQAAELAMGARRSPLSSTSRTRSPPGAHGSARAAGSRGSFLVGPCARRRRLCSRPVGGSSFRTPPFRALRRSATGENPVPTGLSTSAPKNTPAADRTR